MHGLLRSTSDQGNRPAKYLYPGVIVRERLGYFNANSGTFSAFRDIVERCSGNFGVFYTRSANIPRKLGREAMEEGGVRKGNGSGSGI
jgi:hypothetical protein